MKTHINLSLLLFVLLICGANCNLYSQSECSDCHLFTVSRSVDLDVIHYQLDKDRSGRINKNEPIAINWIRLTNNEVEPLTWIQDTYGYGLEYIMKDFVNDSYTFHFVSYKDRIFELRKNDNGEFKIYTNSGNYVMEVSRIFIQIDGGTFWLPEVSRIELHGKEMFSGELIAETITP